MQRRIFLLPANIGCHSLFFKARAGINRLIGQAVFSASVRNNCTRFSGTIQNRGSAIRYISGRSCSNIGEVTQKFTASSVLPCTKSGASRTVRFNEGPLASINSSSGLLNDDGRCVRHLDCSRIFTTLRKVCHTLLQLFHSFISHIHIYFLPMNSRFLPAKKLVFHDVQSVAQRNISTAPGITSF